MISRYSTFVFSTKLLFLIMFSLWLVSATLPAIEVISLASTMASTDNNQGDDAEDQEENTSDEGVQFEITLDTVCGLVDIPVFSVLSAIS